MYAAETAAGPAVAFRYLRYDGSVQAVKVRPIADKDRMFRSPAGAGELPLYGWLTISSLSDYAIVTEGEMDVHALRSAGLLRVVSVPDGAKSKLTAALLAPLHPLRRILIATDADEQGDGLATRLASALGSGRCWRMRFGSNKDANEALLAGWKDVDFRRAMRDAKRMERVPWTGPETRKKAA